MSLHIRRVDMLIIEGPFARLWMRRASAWRCKPP